MTIGNWLKKNASTILTVLGAAGLPVTVVLAVKAAPKAAEAKTVVQDEKGEVLTRMETVQAELPAYLPVIASGTGTLLCIFGANLLSRRQQASLISAYAALEQAFAGYRNHVVAFGGKELDRAVQEAVEAERADREDDRPPWDEAQAFYIDGYPKFFEKTMEEVRTAEYCLNRNFVLRGSATLNEFLRFLGLNDLDEAGERIGWDRYNYSWIDFDHIYRVANEGMAICEISMPFLPHGFDENEWDKEDCVPTCGVD